MGKKLISFDWAIKKILRDKENFVILEGFLSELLKEDITIIEILESESDREYENNKLNRVDILAKDKKESLIIFEIQVNNEYDYFSRILFGVSKTISERLLKGTEYKDVKKVYSISLVYFDLGHGEDYVYHGKTEFYGIHKHDELELNEEQKKLYNTDKTYEIFPEYYIIKVEKFDNETKDNLDEWIYFLKNEQVKEGSKGKGLKEAEEKLNVLNMNEIERRKYNRYLDELHYEASMVGSGYGLGKIEGREEGIKEGIKEGREEGIKEGEKNKSKEIARNLLKNGIDIDVIILSTGLSKEEIEDLNK